MSEFSQLVRARLKAQQARAEHLDPDILAAFAEHRLSEPERIAAVAHLATCADCREVVALASEIEPDFEAATPAKSVPILHRRLRIWRVGMIGALAALAVSATVLLRMNRSRAAIATAKLQVEEPAAAPPSFNSDDRKASAQATSPVAPAVTEKKSEQRGTRQDQSVPGRTSAAVDETLTANAGPGQANGAPTDRMALPRSKVAQAQNAPSAGYVPPATPPPPPQPALTDELAASNKNFQLQQPPSPQPQKTAPQVTASSQSVEVESSAPEMQQSSRAQSNQSPSAQTMDAQLRQPPVAKRSAAAEMQTRNATVGAVSPWSITADGKLQRLTAASPEGAHLTGAAPEGPQWQPVPVDSSVIFRVVNATGRDVWAGGNGGALFHSSDGGDHWSRISPQNADRKLEGDIISIRIASAANQIVRLLTSAGQSWISSDGGATWKVESR